MDTPPSACVISILHFNSKLALSFWIIGKTNNSDYNIELLDRLKDGIAQNNQICRKIKCPFTKKMQRVTSQWKWWQNPWIAFGSTLLSRCGEYFLFSELKRMLAGKNISSNKELVVKTQVYFEAKKKSYYNNGTKKLKGRYTQYITLEGNYV